MLLPADARGSSGEAAYSPPESTGAEGRTLHLIGSGSPAVALSVTFSDTSPRGGNSDDRGQWPKQGGAVGAAASRMRAAAKQTLGAATRAQRAIGRPGHFLLDD